MQLIKKIFYSTLPIIIVFFLSVLVGTSLAHSYENDIFEKKISLRFYDKNLQDVFTYITSETGIKIIYDEHLSEQKVSGNFKEIPLITALDRLLKGVNHSLEMNKDRKTLLIKAFGKVKYTSTTTGSTGVGLLPDKDITYAELKTLLDRQYKEFTKQLNNGEEYLDDFKMTRNMEKNQLTREVSVFKQEAQDPNAFSAGFDITNKEVKELFEQQQELFQRNKMTEDIIGDNGKSMKEYRFHMKKQISNFKKEQQNDEVMVPGLNIRREAYKQLLTEQVRKFKQGLTE